MHMRNIAWILSVAVLAAGSWMLAGCEADDSLPTRPRTANPLAPNQNAQDNAEHRVEEPPPRQLPTDGGHEFPGQSKAAPAADAPRVALADAAGTGDGSQPHGLDAIGHSKGPMTNYQVDNFKGPLPHLP